MFSTSAMLSGTGWWAWPDEAGHRRRVTDGRPRLVGEVHPDQHVAGQDGPLDHLALAVLDLGDLFGRDHDLVDVVLHVERDDAVLEVRADPVLHAVVGVHDVPLAGLGPQLAAELLERVARARRTPSASSVVASSVGLGRRPRRDRLGLGDRLVGDGLVDRLVGDRLVGDGLVGLVGRLLDRRSGAASTVSAGVSSAVGVLLDVVTATRLLHTSALGSSAGTSWWTTGR